MKAFVIFWASCLILASSTFSATVVHENIMHGLTYGIAIDAETLTVTVGNKTAPIIKDYPRELDSSGKEEWDNDMRRLLTADTSAWVLLSYDRFDVYVDSAYYAHNTPAIDQFWDKFEPRYELMEQQTGWSAEKWYGRKLQINVSASIGCYGGYAMPGNAVIHFSDPIYQCGWPYYENGQELYGNPGEFGDYWPYMAYALHETMHAINPYPIYVRLWLTEGFSEYNMYNILTNSGDINQETMDTYIYQGTSAYNWLGYVANDYRDTSGYNSEIQLSNGYDITAWMFSMLRDNYSLDWNDFYKWTDNNGETLDKAYNDLPGWYYIDMAVIDFFARSSSIGTFDNAKPVFRYDGPSGPGWGVRQWKDLNWYADLSASLTASTFNLKPGETTNLIASISNFGGVSLIGVSVRIYNGSDLLNEQFVNVPAPGGIQVTVPFTGQEGTYNFRVAVDEANLKVETNEDNNDAALEVGFYPTCGDINGDNNINILDVSYLINFLYKSGGAPHCNAPYYFCADANGNQSVNILDVSYIINYLYKHGPALNCR
ncbi:exported hypothetical protein [Candidatus Zixiibacteriota bacterium]|nr:exported hypothetical protein [candidate division Zixibacteria bacterium]